MSAAPDTTFTLLRDDGSTVQVSVRLEPDGRPDRWVLDDLLLEYVLDGLLECVARADLPNPWAVEHVYHAVSHLRQGEWTQAWPPLVIGVEGLFWSVAGA